jgi:hypothetical protein
MLIWWNGSSFLGGRNLVLVVVRNLGGIVVVLSGIGHFCGRWLKGFEGVVEGVFLWWCGDVFEDDKKLKTQPPL